MENTPKDIAAGALAGVTFVAFWAGLGLGALPAAAAGAGMAIGSLLLSGRFRRGARFAPDQLDGYTQEDYDSFLAEGRKGLAELRASAAKISKPVLRTRFQDIAELGDRILRELERDPKGVRGIRSFFLFVLDSSQRLVKGWIELSAPGLSDPDVHKSIAKIESSVEMLDRAFESQLKKLLENEITSVDVDLAMLETKLKMEGVE